MDHNKKEKKKMEELLMNLHLELSCSTHALYLFLGVRLYVRSYGISAKYIYKRKSQRTLRIVKLACQLQDQNVIKEAGNIPIPLV